MAIIYSYNTVVPSATDLILGTDVSTSDKATKNFTVQSIVDLIAGGATGLGSVLSISNNAQNVAGANQSAINFLNVTGTGVSTFTSFTTIGGVLITGTAGSGFTTFTSTAITGTLQTAAQPNITSLGILTSLRIGGTAPDVNLIDTSITAPGLDTSLVTEKAIVDYIGTKPNKETLAETLATGNVTGGTDIAVSAGDDITFTDTSKVILGAGSDATIEHDGTDLKIINTEGKTTISNSSGDIDISATAAGKKINIDGKAGIDLIFDTTPRVSVLNTGAKVTGVTTSTGVFQGPNGTTILPTYGFTGDVNTGMYGNGNGEVKLTSNGNTHYTFANAGATFTDGATPPGLFLQSDTFTTTTTTGLGKITRFVLSTDPADPQTTPTTFGMFAANLQVDTMVPTVLAVKTYVDTTNASKTITYKADAATALTQPFTLNLSTQTFDIKGGTNIGTTSTEVAANVGIVTINLDDSVTISGTMNADKFETTAQTATWVTTVLDGFTAITSDLFTGPLVGNADTATALAAVGTMSIDGDFTTTVAPTYTSGGNQTITANMADTVVTGKVLTNLSTATAQTITATDTILEALGYLQSTVTGLPAGLDYIGTWDASGGGGGSPDLTVAATHVPGQYYICSADSPTAGTFPNGGAVGPSEWKVGDWCIRGDAQNDVWQKIDNTSIIDGTGTTDKIARWTGPQTLGTGLISDDGSTVTIGNTGAFLVEGNSTFGNATTDTVLATGPVTFNETLNIKKGIFVDGTQGTDGYVLTSGAGSGAAMSWAQPTVGTLTGITAGTGITVTGSAPSPTVNIDYLGTDNAILSATAYSGTIIPDTSQIWFNDENAGANTVSYAPISILPFDQYSSWNLSDGTNTAIIASTNTAKILGSAGITSVVSPTDKSATLSIDYVGTDNAILSAGAGTPIATDELLFNNADVASGTVQRASIASIIDLGNETLAQVLANDNVTGGTDIVVTNSNITFSDANGTNSGNIIMGASSDMSMGYDSDYGLELVSAAGALSGGIRMDSPLIQLRDLTSPNAKKYFEGATGGAVKLYYDGTQKFQTTNTGTTTTGVSYITGSGLNINSNTVDTLIYLNRTTGIWSIDNDSSYYLNFKATSLGTTNLTLKSTGEVQMPDYGSGTTTGTPTFNLEVDSSGNIIETPSTNPGGGGGTFHGDQAITTTSPAQKAFTLTRAATGTLIFDVWFTSETNFLSSVAKKYTVAHAYNATPVYNKIIDTGKFPNPNPFGTDTGFTVSFVNATALSVECYIIATGNLYSTQNIGYTIQVGYDSTNALTFTPAS